MTLPMPCIVNSHVNIYISGMWLSGENLDTLPSSKSHTFRSVGYFCKYSPDPVCILFTKVVNLAIRKPVTWLYHENNIELKIFNSMLSHHNLGKKLHLNWCWTTNSQILRMSCIHLSYWAILSWNTTLQNALKGIC